MSSDLDAINAYLGILNEFVVLVREAVRTSKPINSNPSALNQYRALLGKLDALRMGAFVAGVHVGWNPSEMDKELEWSRDRYLEYLTNEKSVNPIKANNVYVRDMVHTSGKLDGIVALHEAEQKKSKGTSQDSSKESRNDPRDEWIYNELCKTGDQERKQTQILNDFKRHARTQGWVILSSVQALLRAAKSYAERKRLPRPRKRKG